jgi:NTE family protein
MERALILSGGGARGAFQVGVWRYLQERGWSPDLICGASAGAINAAAIGCGISPPELARIWRQYSRRRVYRLTLPAFLGALVAGKRMATLMDTAPLRATLSEYIDIPTLRRCPIEIRIPIIHLRTSRLRYVTQREITVEHLMAAGAMPILFPWAEIDGEAYWDGGVMANTPLMPAIEGGAGEIVVVLLSPVGKFPQPVPRTLMEAAERAFEQFLIGSCESIPHFHGTSGGTPQPHRVRVVAPEKPMGLASLIRFTPRQSEQLVADGYRCARSQLGDDI